MKKIIPILALTLVLSSCESTKYQSKRHPNGGGELNESQSFEDPMGKEQEIDYQPESSSKAEKKPEEKQIGEEATDDKLKFTVEETTNLRIAPSTDSYILMEVPGGADLLKIGENGDWTRVTYDGQMGYILTELLVPQK